MNDVLDRFARIEHIEQLLSARNQDIEVVCIDGRIIFRTSKGTSKGVAATRGGCTALCGVGALLMALESYSYALDHAIPLWQAWQATTFVTAGLACLCLWYWKLIFEDGLLRQYKFLEIDPARETINIPHWYRPREEQKVAIADILCFYAWHIKHSDGSTDSVRAVDAQGKATILDQTLLNADKTAQILGFLCDKPVYRRGEDGKTSPLTEMFAHLQAGSQKRHPQVLAPARSRAHPVRDGR